MSNPKLSKLEFSFEKLKQQFGFQINLLADKIELLHTFADLSLGIPVARLIAKYFQKKCKTNLKIVFSYRNDEGKLVKDFEYKDLSWKDAN